MHASPAGAPQRQLRSDPRTRPFHDLLARIPELPGRPARIVDLGCGNGTLTAVLAERWPDAHITGVDNSAERLREATRNVAGRTPGGGRLAFGRADLAHWTPTEQFDLVFSNAAIHWVMDHLGLFKRWTHTLPPGGVFAFQIPDNAASHSFAALRALCASPRWRDRLDPGLLPTFDVNDPAAYLDRLAALGFAVDAWETTYAHVMPGEDPFQPWIAGTGLLPLLTALGGDPAQTEEFLAGYRTRLRAAYPSRPYGTVFLFRRVFVVARKTARP